MPNYDAYFTSGEKMLSHFLLISLLILILFFIIILSSCERPSFHWRFVSAAVVYCSRVSIVNSAIIDSINVALTKCHHCAINYIMIAFISFYYHRIRNAMQPVDWDLVIRIWSKYFLQSKPLDSKNNQNDFLSNRRHPRLLNQQDRSNSAPNVCINNVRLTADQCRLLQSARVPPDYVRWINHWFLAKAMTKPNSLFFTHQNKLNQEHSHSTQASPTNTMRHVRQRARSADEGNKNLLVPREQKPTDENWVSNI